MIANAGGTQLYINYTNCWLLIWDQIFKKKSWKGGWFLYFSTYVWLQNFGHSIQSMYCEIYYVTKPDFWGLPYFWFKCLQCRFDFHFKGNLHWLMSALRTKKNAILWSKHNCERWTHIWQKYGQKRSYKGHL